jgi:hypothetical protein
MGVSVITQFCGFREVFFEDAMPPEGETTEETMTPAENIPDDVEPETPDA